MCVCIWERETGRQREISNLLQLSVITVPNSYYEMGIKGKEPSIYFDFLEGTPGHSQLMRENSSWQDDTS